MAIGCLALKGFGSGTSKARQRFFKLGALAVESVAIYLGLHPDIRPGDYLVRLRAEGLTGVDALPADADVAAQTQRREKQLRLVLDQTLARLTPAGRTALDYAALLPPDSIPWPLLRALAAREHPDFGVPGSARHPRTADGVAPSASSPALEASAGRQGLNDEVGGGTPPTTGQRRVIPEPSQGGNPNLRPGYPDPWPALRRRLGGLRLLTPGDHAEIARLHRVVRSDRRLSPTTARLWRR